jgi:hypothetical protein
MPCGFASLRIRHFFRTRFTALETAAPPKLDGGSVLSIVLAIVDLARRDIDDELAELDRVAWSRETFGRHDPSMACSVPTSNRGVIPVTIKLTHHRIAC